MRVALYERVSTEEQAKHGISVEAQSAALHAWAEAGGHTVIGEFTDAGISGKKPYQKRPELLRFMQLLESGEKIDALVFCKLDRFYRSVKLYYQAVDILDRHKCGWVAIQEDYETVTASGRFKVNIMLAVAENEADRTSERIKAVFEHKIEKGEIAGGKPAFGYMVENKRLVPNPETADIAREMFRHYLDTASYYDTARYLHSVTGMKWEYHYIRRCLSNPIYIGKYRSNANYCEPIIDAATFNAAQELMKSRSVRHNPTNRVYIFSGLVRCSCCGMAMVGFTLPKSNGDDYYYRCSEAMIYRRCVHTHSIREERLERWLLDNVAEKLDSYITEYKITAKQRPHDNARIKRKIEKLKELFLNDLITIEQYKAYRAELESQIVEETAPKDFTELQSHFSKDFRSVYNTFSREQRQMFWRGTIDTIELDADNTPLIIFR